MDSSCAPFLCPKVKRPSANGKASWVQTERQDIDIDHAGPLNMFELKITIRSMKQICIWHSCQRSDIANGWRLVLLDTGSLEFAHVSTVFSKRNQLHGVAGESGTRITELNLLRPVAPVDCGSAVTLAVKETKPEMLQAVWSCSRWAQPSQPIQLFHPRCATAAAFVDYPLLEKVQDLMLERKQWMRNDDGWRMMPFLIVFAWRTIYTSFLVSTS